MVKEIIERIEFRIQSLYKDLMFVRRENFSKSHIESFRCRLDELLLLWHEIKDVSFVEACKALDIDYKEVNIQ